MNASFPFFQTVGPITGATCQAGVAGGSWSCARKSRLQAQEAGGREACWEVMRNWADDSSEDGGISLGYRICIEVSDTWANRGVEATKGGIPDDWLLVCSRGREEKQSC